jgi:hypothetical protein
MRSQVEKIKPSNIKNDPIRAKSKIKHQCHTPSCNTQNPSSRFLCDECTYEKYSSQSTSETTDNSVEKIKEKSSTSSRPSYPSLSPTEPKPLKTHSVGSDQTKRYCELCNYNQNSGNNGECTHCGHGHRPQQTKSSSTNHSERSTALQTNVQLNKQGNLLFQSILSS